MTYGRKLTRDLCSSFPFGVQSESERKISCSGENVWKETGESEIKWNPGWEGKYGGDINVMSCQCPRMEPTRNGFKGQMFPLSNESESREFLYPFP